MAGKIERKMMLFGWLIMFLMAGLSWGQIQHVEMRELASNVIMPQSRDVSYSPITCKSYAAVVVFDFKSREPVEEATAIVTTGYPYVPVLLSFREIPPLIKALGKIKTPPDLLVCDGQGIAHQRGMGLATHLGLIFDTPSIGCAKSILIGEPAEERALEKGSSVRLLHPKTGKTVGMLLRTKRNCRPMVISIGHKVSLAFAKKVVLYFSDKYRVPEITRQAHLLSNVIRTG